MKNRRALSPGVCFGLMLALAFTIVPSLMMAEDPPPIVGDWQGAIDPGAQPKQQIVVHVTQSQDGTFGGTIDFPDQHTSDIPLTAITFKGYALHFESGSIHVAYDGTMKKDNSEISGNWKAGTVSLALVLKRPE